MSGTVIRILETTNFSFDSVAAVANSEQVVLLAQHIDTSQWRTAGLMVRVVSLTLPGYANDKVNLLVVNDPWDPMSGTTEYQPVGTYGPIIQQSLNPTDGGTGAPPVSPYGMYVPLSNFGALLAVALQCTRTASSTQGDNIQIKLNVDLVLKD